MRIDDLRYTPSLLSKPFPRGLAVETTLRHFAIVTYWVDPAAIDRHLHPRFVPVCLRREDGAPGALVSVVTFLDQDFRFVACPWIRRSFGQTNYRAYVVDTHTGEQAAWFFGTCLDSIAVAVPRYIWKLPWHYAHLAFDCRYDDTARRYTAFNVSTRSRWSPGTLAIEDSGAFPDRLVGISNLEAGLVLLTHPLRGYFFRSDGALGSYTIWHDRARPTVGSLREAKYPLLETLGLVAGGDVRSVHSVLMQPSIDFTIYLPPSRGERSDLR